MKKMPLGIQNFREIIHGGYVYADKTQFVYSLTNDAKYYFLSRPRRFGKSLLLDTIGEAFSGDKELFKGLWIYNSDFGFEKHPVLRLDMSRTATESPETLKASLLTVLGETADGEGLDVAGSAPSDFFQFLIKGLHDKYGQRVVVLIDEYDKPILDRLSDIDVAEANRDVLRGFYGILKPMDQYLRMTFITGVTKFTKTSIFSELNNLFDITLTERYANICGIEVGDLEKYFGGHIAHLSSRSDLGRHGNLHDEILAWYDGYSWDGKTRVINPFSLLSFFKQERFSSFWYSSGTPKFLMDLIKGRPRGYADLRNLEIGEWALDTFDIRRIEVEPLLFQTGYLTVKDVLTKWAPPSYLLVIPNFEVRQAFNLHVLAEFTESGAVFAESAHKRIRQALDDGDLQGVVVALKSLFASIPYELHIGKEAYYHSIFYAIMNLFGFDIAAEVSVSGGRIDATLELQDKAYVIEFKYEGCEPDASPEHKQALSAKALDDGIKQIKDRGYADKYAGSGKTVHLAAFAFLGRDEIGMRSEVIAKH